MCRVRAHRARLPTLVPPHTYSTCPVTKPLAGSAKKRTARATSADSPSRLTGTDAASARSFSLPGSHHVVEHVGADRTRRHHVDGDALGRELERPGARHAQHAGLGGRVAGARGQADARRATTAARRGRSAARASPAAPPARAGWRSPGAGRPARRGPSSFTSASSAARITPALCTTVVTSKRRTSSRRCLRRWPRGPSGRPRCCAASGWSMSLWRRASDTTS